ncbi:MAG: sodium:solute symporter [Prevotella sp.]|nr:sodium:solute symporter [Prevotella sp.]
MMILAIVLGYFCLLFAISRWTGRRADNDTFYRGNRQSPWYMVAFGMIGASISGVTFVSVPGMVTRIDMTYLQTCMGFILGYVIVAFVLLPLYYRLNLTTIYSFLGQRIGRRAYRTGASFFLLSKMTGAAVRFYVVCWILQQCIMMQIPDGMRQIGEGWLFTFTVLVMVALIWLYTRKGGIRTLVWTDSLQTACLFGALILMLIMVTKQLEMGVGDAVSAIADSEMSRIFVFDDWMSKQNFWKQFFSGVFIVIVMTGLDQDMMQKNLTCSSLRDAQKDMTTYGVAFLPANLLFLSLGALLVMLAHQRGIAIPEMGDQLLPTFAASGLLGPAVVVLFILGILAASFSSADSALTAMTTSFCVDICGKPNDENLRKRSHLIIAVIFVVFVLLFRLVNSTSVIDAIYVLCGYTYGPLLGLFAFGLLTHRQTNDRWVPYVCLASPLFCWGLDAIVGYYTGYRFGYELLMLNGLFTFVGLLALRPTSK